MMREIVLDTETTGMDPAQGDRLVEIGCVELENHLPTGRTYHVYINPEREIPAEATAVHGITNDFVKDRPTFGEVVGDFLDFIGDAQLVIHNAEFDMKFLNAELKIFGFPSIDSRRAIDTLKIARMKFPGSPANLDALCRRFGIDNSSRNFHGALLDSQLLAEVYLELLGGRQQGLAIVEETAVQSITVQTVTVERVYREPRAFPPSEEDIAAHDIMIDGLKDPLWKRSA
ncbi:MAG TPA: DNA polymerase III subunit epsilon [Micavibrio sp.]|nr:DNA polymerase III subunit epsilon [Micavibrio sp.]